MKLDNYTVLTKMSSDEIDALLERYLSLLDTYKDLRDKVTRAQSSVSQYRSRSSSRMLTYRQIHHSIALTNFNAERGRRYGQDYYDGRLQATRILSITAPASNDVPYAFVISSLTDCTTTSDDIELEANGDHEASSSEPAKQKCKDPICMFGLLAPRSLRDAQKSAIKLVADLTPKIVTVDKGLAEMEIQIRRARKKLAKEDRNAKVQKSPMEAPATSITA